MTTTHRTCPAQAVAAVTFPATTQIETPRARRSPWRRAMLGALLVIGVQSHAFAASAVELVVPAYFDPSATGGQWNNLTATAAQKVPTTVIMNPDNGPGTAQQATYTAAIAKVHAAGGKVVGYVSTRGTKRSLSDVVKDINTYIAFYKMDGFFIDEMTDDSKTAHVQFYQSVYNYIKGLSSAYTVTANPGTNIPEIYASLPTADQFVVYEDLLKNYAKYQPEAWQAAYPSRRFVHMIYNVPAAQEQTVMKYATTHGAGGVYITSLTLPNPYKALPSYWTQETSDAAAGE